MAQSAEFLVGVVAVSGTPALVAVVGGCGAVVALQAVLLRLVAGRARLRLLHRIPAVLTRPEALTVGHRLAAMADLTGVRPVTQVA